MDGAEVNYVFFTLNNFFYFFIFILIFKKIVKQLNLVLFRCYSTAEQNKHEAIFVL